MMSEKVRRREWGEGRDRFDLCVARGTCNKFGVNEVSYTAIKTSKRHW